MINLQGKSPKLLDDYYNSLFIWLKKCESVFGFEPNQKYGLIRIYIQKDLKPKNG